jgi:hypothetical protein
MEFEADEHCNVTFTDLTVTGSNTSILSWHWDFGDGYYSYNQSPQHTYMMPGTYRVCLKITAWTGEEYCHYELCKEITLEGCTFARQIFSNIYSSTDAVKIVPNPSDGNFRIEFNSPGETSSKISMLNALGQTVLMKDYTTAKGMNMVEIDAGTLPKGVYIIKIYYGEQYQIVRVLLQ